VPFNPARSHFPQLGRLLKPHLITIFVLEDRILVPAIGNQIYNLLESAIKGKTHFLYLPQRRAFAPLVPVRRILALPDDVQLFFGTL
jgi:hypothetical protein